MAASVILRSVERIALCRDVQKLSAVQRPDRRLVATATTPNATGVTPVRGRVDTLWAGRTYGLATPVAEADCR
jgi:hypothetical protein